MLNKSKSTLAIVVVLTVAICMHRSKTKKITVSPEVEAAINSTGPIPVTIPADANDNYHKITLGDWSHLDIDCAFPAKWHDGYVSRNNIKTKTSVLKRADGMLQE